MSLNIRLLDLVGIERLDQILNGFTAVTGVASIIADPNGYPLTRPHNFTLLCQKYCRSTPEGRHKCYQSDRFGGAESARAETPPIYVCLNAGLLDCAAPVIVGGSHLATVLCGQVLEEPLESGVAELRARAIGVTDLEGYLGELHKVPLMSRERLFDVATLMSIITKTISELALGNYQLHRQSRDYLNQVINAVSDCIIAMDSKGIISVINEAGACMFGSKAQNLIGQSVDKLFSGEVLVSSGAASSAPPFPSESRREMMAVRGDSREFPVHVSVSAVCESREDDPNYVAVVRDISEERRIARMKEDLIGMVMHDIRNPVLSLQRAMQLLADGSVGSLTLDQLEIVHLALGTSHQLFGMASNLLDIYRNENGQLLLLKSPMDLGQVIQEAIGQFEFFAGDKHVTMAFHGRDQGLRLFGDRRRLLRTCGNLVDNAIKYSPEGGEVLIRCRKLTRGKLREAGFHLPADPGSSASGDRGAILTMVRDQGPGIPEEFHDKVFDKFFTVESRDLPERKGVGLGLAFCRQVVESHGGDIWVKSPLFVDEAGEARGCELAFLLPVRAAKEWREDGSFLD